MIVMSGSRCLKEQRPNNGFLLFHLNRHSVNYNVLGRRHFSRSSLSAAAAAGAARIVDLRSDTVTAPSRYMLEAALTAPTGDDVLGEDPTVHQLEEYMAELFGKQKGLFVPTGTMANLVAIMSHCHGRSSEMMIGQNSHISLWEAGNAASLGGVYARQLAEDEMSAELQVQDVRDACNCLDQDDHVAKTELLCLENTHNILGGAALPLSHMTEMGNLTKESNIKLHVDGARIFNASVALGISVQDLCAPADSVAICLSKGLGAPLGSVLVGESEFIRLAKRARKRCGGGMRQAGVVASMGYYAVCNNVNRLVEDHERAKRLAAKLEQEGFRIARNGRVDTNMFYFRLPLESPWIQKKDYFARTLSAEYGVKLVGGYSRGKEYFRVVTHMDLDNNDIDQAAEAIVKLAFNKA